jgi:hypothetical protein
MQRIKKTRGNAGHDAMDVREMMGATRCRLVSARGRYMGGGVVYARNVSGV